MRARIGTSPRRSVGVAIVATLGVVAMATAIFLIYPPNPAGASSRQIVPLLEPPVLPPIPVSVPVTTAAGLELGAGVEVSTGAAASGAVADGAACGAVSGGSCLLIGGVLLGSFLGTTAVLHWVWPCGFSGHCTQAATTLPTNVIQSDLKPCSSSAGAGFSAAEAAYPGAMCAQITVQGGPTGDRWELMSGLLSSSGSMSSVPNLLTRVFNYLALPNELNGCCWGPGGAVSGTQLLSSTFTIVRAVGLLPQGCRGLPTCGLRQNSMLQIRSVNGSQAAMYATVPLDKRLYVHGETRRLETTATCFNVASGTTTTSQLFSVWFTDDHAKEHPIEIPHCPSGTQWVIKRLITDLRRSDGSYDRLFDASLPDTLLAKIPSTCLGGQHCTPQTQVVNGVTVCMMGGVQVDMMFCTNAQTVATQAQTTGVIVGEPVTAPAIPHPGTPTGDPPTSTDTGDPVTEDPGDAMNDPVADTPDTDSRGDCLPHGWGLLNPVDWVVKPVKCALRWAFVPTEGFTPRLTRLHTEFDDSAVGSLADVGDSLGGAITSGLSTAQGGSCTGPELKFRTSMHGAESTYHPFSSCSDPEAGYASWTRTIASAVIVLAAFRLIFMRVVGAFFGKTPAPPIGFTDQPEGWMGME
ncbi:MAG: hypothetical protein JWM89_1530 [Acidimicrobiales bacterium]|nr:hypothetical protein [Acidimicrobiales bacterium]